MRRDVFLNNKEAVLEVIGRFCECGLIPTG